MTATSSSRRGGRPRPRRRVLVLVLAAVFVGAALVAGIGYATGLIGEGSRTDPAANADGGAASGGAGDEGADGTSSSEKPDPHRLTVTVSGDLLWHEEVWASGENGDGTWDFTDMFADVKPMIEGADVAICHQETVFAPPEGPYLGYPGFQSPPQVIDAIKDTGWDMCTTASNHSVDAGTEGLFRTLDTFDQAGILHSGAARSPEEMDQPRVFTAANGARIAVVTGTYGTNGIPVEHPWLVGDLHPDTLLAKAAAARAAGADIVMVAMHAGEEAVVEPTQQQTELAQILTASPDVDVVYGHHIHAVQPIEQVNGKWVIYGLGNMVAHQSAETVLSYEGITVELEFARGDGRWGVAGLSYIPTVVTPYLTFPVRVAPVSTLMERMDADGADPGARGFPDRARLEESLARTRGAIFSRGLDPALVTEK
ncbi:CapA family protein [Corynebacterium freneyi]|uniref:CapA family protein n=1 Tax=Corynebacterium freneyi TaxID=134034 RepID=UPI0006907209|nr:CapA family protein [Corynebacterium freneyi]